MRSTKLISSVALVLALGLVYSFGCIFNPKPDPEPDPGPKIDWPDLTQKEDVIEYMLLTYQHRDSGQYEKLLHPQYIWFMQDRDAEKYNTPTLDYAQDTGGTTRLFNRAVMLDLEIEDGTWEEAEAVGEVPCPGCWQTDRIYTIQVQLPGYEKILVGHDYVKFIIVPVEEGGETKYKIRWAYDIDLL